MTRARLRDIQTELVHSGDLEEKVEGAVVLPIFQSATYVSGGGEASYDEIRYLRLNNSPNHRALHYKLATIAGGEDAVGQAMHGYFEIGRVAGCDHRRDPLGGDTGVELDAVDLGGGGLAHGGDGGVGIGDGLGDQRVPRRRAVEKGAQAEDAGPWLVRPFAPALEDPLQVIARIADGGHSIGEEERSLPAHEVHMGVDQAWGKGAAGIVTPGDGGW